MHEVLALVTAKMPYCPAIWPHNASDCEMAITIYNTIPKNPPTETRSHRGQADLICASAGLCQLVL